MSSDVILGSIWVIQIHGDGKKWASDVDKENGTFITGIACDVGLIYSSSQARTTI